MYLLIAGVLLTATSASGAFHELRSDSIVPDTSIVAQADSSTTPPNIGTRPSTTPALGTIESVETATFVLSASSLPADERVDATLDAVALVGDSIADPLRLSDTTFRSRRPRAIEYSEAYHTRLKIHQIGAYAMLPLFISEYIIGQKLLTSTNRSQSLKTAHSLIAAGLGIVFVSNTITGAWNMWDARKDPNGRARREIHSVLMLASDVGMVATAMSASKAKRSLVDARRHRTIAISSIALTAIGSGMMWLWRN
ncbi:MAG: hypothetical protein ACM34L_01400 [Gemmatimonas sp.]